ncbi:MAG: DPP IV N-terminal domain-containing protein, partial [Pontibacter sp.]|nr:DPP IV N-terminal domain-containing protein [Pontibacter sp.]
MTVSYLPKRLALLLVFLAVTLQLKAQDKMLTMEDAILNPALQPQSLRQLSWISGTSDYAYVKQENGTQALMRGSATSGKEFQLLPLQQLSAAVEAAGADKMSSFPTIYWADAISFVIYAQNRIMRYNLKSGKATVVTTYAETADYTELDPTMQRLAYTNGNNLYVSAPGAPDQPVTKDANVAVVYGQAAHRSEFGITKGTFWSSSGGRLAFYRMDQSMVTDYPLVDIAPLPAKQNNIKYPMAGGQSHHVTVGVYDVSSKQTVYLKTGEPADQYLTNVTWSPDEKHIYIAVLNRDQNHMKLNSYSSLTGEFERTLFEEKQEKYVEPEHGLYFVPTRPDQFVWISERSGFDHLYLYDTSGRQIRQLTSGDWMVTEVLGFSRKGDELYYTSTAESPLERHIYAVSLRNGKTRRISQGTGTHYAQL